MKPQLTIRVTEEFLSLIDKTAEDENRSRSNMVYTLIQEALVARQLLS